MIETARNQIMRRLRRHYMLGRRGIAALEFGLLSPVFLIVLAGVVDICNATVAQSILNASAAAGANYALVAATQVDPTNGQTLANQIADIVANGNSTAWANVTVVVNNGPSTTIRSGSTTTAGTPMNDNTCYCPTVSGSTVTWGAAATCGSSCTGGGNAGQFVTITATYSFTPFFSGYGFVPAGNISAFAVVQTSMTTQS